MKREKKNVRFPIFRERFLQLKGDKTTVEFAQNLGMSRATVGFYEAGERIPDALGVEKICRVCNVSADWLLGLSAAKTMNITTQAMCQETGLSEKAVEKIQNISRSGDNLTEALTFLIEHRELLRLLYCIRDLNNPEIFKLDDRAGLDYIYRVVHDLQSPKIDAIGSVQYRGSRTFGNIMEDALKQNVGNQKEEV